MAKHDPKIGRAIGGAIDKTVGGAIGVAVGTVGKAGRVVGSVFALPGLTRQATHRHPRPGAVAGIESHEEINTPPAPDQVVVHAITYSPGRTERRDVTLDELPAFLAEPAPEWATVRWINVDGLHAYVVQRFREAFDYHTLAAEDVLHVPQRPKVEAYDNQLFIVTRMLMLDEHRRLRSEQVSMFLHGKTLVTFQEHPGDVWEPIRKRIDNAGSKLRTNGPDYLVYALLDAIVDHGFPILEHYGDLLEALEHKVVRRPSPHELQQINAIKRELSVLRRVVWPARELVSGLMNDELEQITHSTRTFLRDVYEHTVQLVDLLETFREMAGGLTDLHMSAVSNRMNEVMKVLTIIATLFIPITFLAGIYGMNFEHMPELHQRWAYPAFWVICAVITISLLIYFWRKGWIGGRR